MRTQFYLAGVVASVLAAPFAGPAEIGNGTQELEHETGTTGSGRTSPRSEAAGSLLVIPISHRGCESRVYDTKDEAWVADDIYRNLEQLPVEGRSAVSWIHRTAVWWICNCKFNTVDTFPYSEYQQAKAAIDKHCGVGQAGWIYAKKWEKGYNVDNSEVLNLKQYHERCPPNCLERP